jgi:hypothetical protein
MGLATVQACKAIVAVVAVTTSGGQDSHLQAVLLSLSTMTKVLHALDASLAEAGALPGGNAVWCSGLLPLVDALLYSERCVCAFAALCNLGFLQCEFGPGCKVGPAAADTHWLPS